MTSRPTKLWTRNIRGVELKLLDVAESLALQTILREMERDEYGLDKLALKPGDLVIDCGAHVGAVSIYLAKRYPGVEIFAFEPLPINRRHFAENLKANDCESAVRVSSLAVTRDGRGVTIYPMWKNTGGSRIAPNGNCDQSEGAAASVQSLTLDAILAYARINADHRCKLLKIDIEGAEYEAVPAFHGFGLVDALGMEIHAQPEPGAAQRLVDYCRAQNPTMKTAFTYTFQEGRPT